MTYHDLPLLRRIARKLVLDLSPESKCNRIQYFSQRRIARDYLRWMKETTKRSSSLRAMVDQFVVHHRPLAYILGTQPFGTLPISLDVKPPILIPRQETEEWTLRLANLLERRDILAEDEFESNSSNPDCHRRHIERKPFRILEIGTGTGCISLLLAYELLNHSKRISPLQIISVDKDERAISLARQNLSNLCLAISKSKSTNTNSNHLHLKEDLAKQLKSSITFYRDDIFSPDFVSRVTRIGTSVTAATTTGGISSSNNYGDDSPDTINNNQRTPFDLLVSNPPYITPSYYNSPSMDISVKQWESRLALVGVDPSIPALGAGVSFSSSGSNSDGREHKEEEEDMKMTMGKGKDRSNADDGKDSHNSSPLLLLDSTQSNSSFSSYLDSRGLAFYHRIAQLIKPQPQSPHSHCQSSSPLLHLPHHPTPTPSPSSPSSHHSLSYQNSPQIPILALEVGHDQAKPVREIFEQVAGVKISGWQVDGIERVVVA